MRQTEIVPQYETESASELPGQLTGGSSFMMRYSMETTFTSNVKSFPAKG